MCGIAGFIDLRKSTTEEQLRQNVLKMTDVISHRGPDDFGVWIDASSGIALGHRRLAILDLSWAGHQPMKSMSDRYIIIFNGEIYNFTELRTELITRGYLFNGHSDTEVMLCAFEEWGVENALQHFIGMFAFAVWDRQEKCLYLARDRFGEKPLYYGQIGNVFLFGSELKALKAHPDWRADIDRGSLTLLMRHNYIPAPYSIYKQIAKLKPGSLLVIRDGNPDKMEVKSYWSLAKCVEHGHIDPFTGTETEAVTQLETLFRDAITKQMIAHVPLGAFLSGGIDSSTVVALMQTQSTQRVQTFTIGFSETKYDEATYAKAVAMHLNTDHTELYVTPQQSMAVIEKLPSLYDEPFSDSSQIPTYLISQLARQHVTVSLSGDGGDELFAGYNRYFFADQLWKKLQRIPLGLRRLMVKSLLALPVSYWDRIFSLFKPVLRAELKHSLPGDKLHKLAEILSLDSFSAVYLNLISHWKEPSELVLGGFEPITEITNTRNINIDDVTERMMYLDSISYLPDDILVKVDRAAMGVSLETRMPFLDHRIAKFAWRLPLSLKIKNGQSKWLLRQILYKYVPQELIDRPKMGFGIPLDSWLRGPLKDWAENLLSENNLKTAGFFNVRLVRNKWEEHLSGKRNWQYPLWNVLMFQAWLAQEARV